MPSPIGSKRNVKIFVLYLLENINYPLEYCTINDIVMQTDYVMFLDFAESFNEMVDGGLIDSFEEDGLTYYQISEMGKVVAGVQIRRPFLDPRCCNDSRSALS